jgi:multidrug efflux pump subunit AcrB
MEKIRKHVEELFSEAPKTKKIKELQEELIVNLEEKYNDFIKDGVDEKQAYNDVVSSIGDIDELIADFKEPQLNINKDEVRRKNALVVSICVGLYIMCLISVIVLSEMGMPDAIIASSFFGIAGISTCILIYHFMSVPKYKKVDDTLVEEFKEWKQQKTKTSELRKGISSILWTLIVVIYIVICFTFSAFHISWIIFLIGVIIQNIINLIFKMREMK